jgi:hypothetical protein
MIFTLLLALACKTEGPCADVCDLLVMDCDYTAYPTRESCMQGCSYDESKGADIEKRLECLSAAECDTFEVIECEHAGAASQ